MYQLGWRLGGKGASGRGKADRIEEHGLHLLLGFYDNAFAMLREVYGELDRDPRECHIATWRDALVADPTVALADLTPDGQWTPWVSHFPAGPGDPGDPPPAGRRGFSVQAYLVRGAVLLRELFASAYRHQAQRQRESGARPGVTVGERIDQLLRYGGLATAAAVVEAAELLRTVLGGTSASAGQPIRLLEALTDVTRRMMNGLLVQDHGMRRLWEVIDLVLAILRGAVRFGLVTDPRGFDAVDDYDWREWLVLNGASEGAVNSAFTRGIYNLCLAYEDGDERRPALSAACALRAAVRMFFGYRGALFWRMTAGMGDIVYAPIYQVLRRRGVRFEFFHRLENVALAESGSHVEALHFDVQARPRGEEYEPLVDVRGLPCWPAEPVWERLEDGERLRDEGWRTECHWDRRRVGEKVLRVGEDFDVAVLAVGFGAVAPTCRALVAHSERWRQMVTHVKAVATQAFQIWMHADMKQLGWDVGPVNLAGFTPPFETWSDMQHLIPEESWARAPRSLAYFCSVLPTPVELPARDDQGYPERRRREVERNVTEFLDRDIKHLWPLAVGEGGGFRWGELVDAGADRSADPKGAASPAGRERVATQYFTANIQPTGYYTLSLPGTSRYRISPLDATFDNLRVAGDWTESGLNTGCIEGAVMSGLVAAHAICGEPRLESIVGYDHP